MNGYAVHQAGGRRNLEYWIPAEDLGMLNANIMGRIQAIEQVHE